MEFNTMKKIPLYFAFILCSAISQLSAQEKIVNLFDSANVYYQKRDFKKAAYFYDTYYLVQKNDQSNYDTYQAAVASSYVNHMANAAYYIKRSGEIAYDYTAFYGFPGYEKFVNDTLHIHLRELKEWKNYITVLKYKGDSADVSIRKITAALQDTVGRINRNLAAEDIYWKKHAVNLNAAQLISKIKNSVVYPSISKTDFWTQYNIKVNDTLTVPFLVYIPKNYNRDQKTPLYVYLHGAVAGRLSFGNPAWVENSQEIKIIDKVKEQNAIIIYPFGKKDFGWIYQQQAFETILREITFIKSFYNINDNKVYITGHSNGGTGAFWFAINKPSAFAAYLGLNYLPKVYGSNTSIRNLGNVNPFFGISGLQDNVFPFKLVNQIYQYSASKGANWTNYAKEGNHGLAIFQRDSINFIFDTLKNITRIPFPNKLQWETDDVRNGRISWLEITGLDTTAKKADWHTALNPVLTQKEKTEQSDFNKNRSGAILATVEGNTIHIKSSRVKTLRLFISADMFDLNKPIKIIVNDKTILSTKVSSDKNIIVEEFLETRDRDFIVSNIIELKL